MKAPKFALEYFLAISLVINSSCQKSSESNPGPDYQLAKEFGIDSSQLVYQYYQKYGFTDVCEEIRMVSKTTKVPNLDNTLPFKREHLIAINSFPNRVDKINDSAIFLMNNRHSFDDIELDFREFNLDPSLTISLKEGKYQINQNEFQSILTVYDENSNYIYVEVLRCDGR